MLNCGMKKLNLIEDLGDALPYLQLEVLLDCCLIEDLLGKGGLSHAAYAYDGHHLDVVVVIGDK
jgi:hypothetical protein